MIGIHKVFSSMGLSGVKEVAFKNIQEATGINLIYMSDNNDINYSDKAKNGNTFLQKYLAKAYFQYVVIPMNFTFYNRRVQFNKYFKYLKGGVGSKLRILRKFNVTKSDIKIKSVFYDLTALNENYNILIQQSHMKGVTEFLSLIENIAHEAKGTYYQRDTFVLLDIEDFGDRTIIQDLAQYARINNGIYNKTDIQGILVRVDGRFYPLTVQQDIKDNNGNLDRNKHSLGLNYAVYNKVKEIRVMLDKKEITKDIAKENNLEFIKSTETKVENTTGAKKNVYRSLERRLDEIHKVQKEVRKSAIIDEEKQREINVLIDKAQNTVMKSKELKGKGIEAKTEELLKKPEFAKYKKVIEDIKNINLKYNGAIKIDKDLIKKSSETYYDSTKATGIETYTAYNKQQTEFNEVLDEAMFDLFKGIEQDKEAGIQVQGLKIGFEDNYKSRFKIYKIKLKNTKFGYEKPYYIELKIPYPVNGKYLKLDGNNYIMTNQFFPHPIIKVQSSVVRMYTHFSTAAVELKGTILNKNSDFKKLKDEFLKNLTAVKKLKSTKDLSSENIQKIKDDFNLPSNLNDGLIFNIEIK
jgi:hypothetical protein